MKPAAAIYFDRMSGSPPVLSVFDTKPYDVEYLKEAAGRVGLNLRFHDFRMEQPTIPAVQGATSACIFVNDCADAAALAEMQRCGVGHLALRSAGFNHVDLEAARSLGIRVTRVPSYSPHAVAEHTVALLLSLNRKIHRAYNRVRELNFSLGGLVGFDLFGKYAGVVGTGRTGRLVAEIFTGLKMRVLALDPNPDFAWAEACGVSYVALDELAARSDVISLHAPLNPATHHLVNADLLSKMKRGVVLVNVSRGGLIHTKALISALKSGHISGVALDVYEEEEGVFFEDLSNQVLQDDELARLLTFPNVLVTAHQAFLTKEALSEISRVTVENVMRHHRGEEFLKETVLV